MAEILLKVANDPKVVHFDNGDCICAFTDFDISRTHVENICHPVKAGFDSDGKRPAGSLADKFFSQIYEYRFEIVSATELKRITLADSSEEIISNNPNANGESIDVQLFLNRRLKNPKHRIFNDNGLIFWYGGKTHITDTKLDAVWNEIETDTVLKKVQHTKYPLGTQEFIGFVPISVSDLSLPTKQLAIEPLYLTPDVMLKKRASRINWEERDDIAKPIKDKISSRDYSVDLRDDLQIVLEDNLEIKGL